MATRYTQPQAGPLEIDWGNPIARGLAYVGLAGSSGVVASTAGLPFTSSASSVVVPFGVGNYVVTPGGTNNSILQTGSTGITGTSYSLFAFGSLSSTSVVASAIDDDLDTSSPRCFQFRVNAAKTELITFDTGGSPYFATSAALSQAQLIAGVAMGAVINGNSIAAFQNGVKTAGSASNTQRQPTGNFFIGQHKGVGGSGWTGGGLGLTLAWTRALSDAEMLSLSANPWQLFKAPRRVLRAAGASGTAVNPGAGAISLTGYAPTLAQTANRALTAGVGNIAITGYAPTISQPVAVAPGAGAIALTGYAPTVAQPIAVAPGVGSIALTGYAPAVTQPHAVAPGAGSLAITGYAPTLAQTANQALTPGAGPVALTGYAPTVSQSAAGTVQPGVGSIAITGYAPAISQPIAVAPGAGAIALTGYSPSVTQPHAVAAGVGSLVLTGYAPLTAQTTDQSVAPAVGSVALTGYAPSVTQAVASQILIPGVGTLAITGYPPLVAQAGAIEFGSPLIVTPTPRNWIASSEPRVWVAANPPRNWIATKD